MTARRITPSQARFVRFVLSGGLASLVFFASSYGLLRLETRPFLANLAAYAVAFGVGYVMQRAWTFRAQHAHSFALPRYFTLQALLAVLTAAAGEAGVGWLGLTPLAVSLGSTLLAGALSYVASILWVFPATRD